MQWHYTKQGQQFGPVDDAELLRLAQLGQITPEDLVWNPTIGEKWVSASSVKNLFVSPPTIAPTAVIPGDQTTAAYQERNNTHNRDLMRMARESLQGHWGLGVGVTVLYFIIDLGVSFIPFFGFLVSLLISGPMSVGLCLVFLMLARQSSAEAGQLFHGFTRFGTALGAYLLMTLFIILWSLLFIIPGIIAAYSYAMTYFIIADDSTVGPLQAITQSKEMMRGRKWKLFCMYLRFFGWALLSILTFGIGFLWLGPYIQTSLAHFYDDVRQRK